MRQSACFLVVALAVTLGCERATRVTVSGRDPAFVMSGSGILVSFTVYEPPLGRHVAFPDRTVSPISWRLGIKPGHSASRVSNLHLTYGDTPGNYEQLEPRHQERAKPLSIGNIYAFFAETNDAAAADGFFYMSVNGPVQVSIPELCAAKGEMINCGTKQQYTEPRDLEKFVQQHAEK